MMYLIERLIDKGARALGMDPAEVRRRNVIPASAMPYRTAHGITYDSGDPGATLEAALGRLSPERIAERKAEAARRGKLRGLGLGSAIEALIVFYDEPAWLEVDAEGGILCLCGTQSSGQGHATAFAQLVAGRMGVPLQKVRILQGDTRRIPGGNGTGASRSISSGGSAVALAVEDLIARGGALTAKLCGVAADSVAFRDGAWEIAGTNQRLTLPDLASRAAKAGSLGELAAKGVFSPKDGTYPYGTHACEVEIDPRTGSVEIVNYASAHDVGFAVNPTLIDGQVHGSTVQGIGQALLEQVVYDEAGQLLTGSFMDYGLPRAADAPRSFTASMIEIPCANNPLGAKGVGESGTLGAPPAVINAILDALAPLGVEDVEMPATPERVWQAIRNAANGKGSA
jgi:carbon-monoxide dehydrogenase large subunit